MLPVLVKVPLLLLAAHAARVAAKSPNPPATAEEQARYSKDNRIRDPVTSSALWRAKAFRRTIYAVSVLEAVVVLASAFTPTSLARLRIPLDPSSIACSPAFLIGVAFMSLGAALRAACYRHLGRLFTFELSLKHGHRLVTDGPYAVVRHPAYGGSMLFYAGACCTHLGPGSLLAAGGLWGARVGVAYACAFVAYGVYVCAFLVARVSKEDLVMKQQFGGEWTEWAKHTPFRLIPYIY